MISRKRQKAIKQETPVPLAHEPAAFGSAIVLEIYRIWRDSADQDYISARSAYQSELWGSFQWSGLQATEKYLKTILLLAGRDTRPFSHGHGLDPLFEEAEKAVPALNHIEKCDREFISHLSRNGCNRYLVRARVKEKYDLFLLDRITRRLRMYCDYRAWDSTGGKDSLVSRSLPRDAKLLWKQICTHDLPGGYLEKVVAGKVNAMQRRQLVWRNAMYCSRPCRHISPRTLTWAWVSGPTGLNGSQLAWLTQRMRVTGK
jgi:hypothetical protein